MRKPSFNSLLKQSRVSPVKGETSNRDAQCIDFKFRFDDDCLYIGFDSEYVYNERTKSNNILSWQYVASSYGGETVSNIIFCKHKRYQFKELLKNIIEDAINNDVIQSYPRYMVFGAHFLRADLSSFADFFSITGISAVRKTVASLNKNHFVKLYDKNRNVKSITVRFVDTQLLTPGNRGLSYLGELLGLDKVLIPDPYSIERMDEFLNGAREQFIAYAMRDAEIVHKYLMVLLKFAEDELERRYLPVTLASLGITLLLKSLKDQSINLDNFLGQDVTHDFYFCPETNRIKRKKVKESVCDAHTFDSFASICYHGGRNEAMICGYTPIDEWFDYDLPSAYTTALLDIRPLDFYSAIYTRNVDDFVNDIFGFAEVEFSFPHKVRYPSLPVEAGERGLIYPYSGISRCTSAEIQVALNLGADIKVIRGVVIPWKDETVKPFTDFSRMIRTKRQEYTDESTESIFKNLLYKEIGNSVYGKVAQGLKNKTAFDIDKGENRFISRSKISSPFYACHTTGLIRAVISELLNAIPEDKIIVSVTTDGFITNASLDEIDTSLPMATKYKALLSELVPNKRLPILEEKHKVKQLCCMKTRGQFTVLSCDDKPIILAKASVEIPDTVDSENTVQNAYFSDLYFNRFPKQKFLRTSLSTTRETFLNKSDMVRGVRWVTLNLEYDMKRQFNTVELIKIGHRSELFITTKPWNTSSDSLKCRSIFDHWRKDNCLKNMDDYINWNEYYHSKLLTRGKGVYSQRKNCNVLVRMFLGSYTHGEFSFSEKMSYKQLSEKLNELGFAVNENTIKNSKRKGTTEKVVSNTEVNIESLRKLLSIAPDFPYQKYFVANVDLDIAS